MKEYPTKQRGVKKTSYPFQFLPERSKVTKKHQPKKYTNFFFFSPFSKRSIKLSPKKVVTCNWVKLVTV